jgi:hypothetical protein
VNSRVARDLRLLASGGAYVAIFVLMVVGTFA